MATATITPAAERADPARGKGVMLYDGMCPLCLRGVRVLKKLDWFGQLQYQDCRDTANLPPSEVPLTLQRMLEEMHVVTPDRKHAHAGFAAFRWMAWRLPATAWLAPLLYIPGVPWLGHRAYLWVAKHRYDLVPCGDGGCQVRLPVQKPEDRGQRTDPQPPVV
ncbi:thiol-disulfide oxidoreductase DCC family protein [Gemmata sp.]|uniref:thiol-disulfide oxidoreductase DCC family protein n=1 Tax=Gemmata sp. TaxID=1914242 RepID=UPI003F6ECCA9